MGAEIKSFPLFLHKHLGLLARLNEFNSLGQLLSKYVGAKHDYNWVSVKVRC